MNTQTASGQQCTQDASGFLGEHKTPWKELTEEELQKKRDFCDQMKEQGRLKVLNGIPDQMRQDWISGVEGGAISNVSISPDRFRELSDQVCGELVEEVMKEVDGEVMVIYPWRAALAFMGAFADHGIKNHCHFGVCRNEETLDVEIYLPLDEDIFKDKKVDTIILADPMFATGGSFDTVLQILKSMDVAESKIKIVSVIGAPEGVSKILEKYPDVEVVLAALDGRLNHNGHIVEQGLGDYGDKWLDRLDIEDFIKKYAQFFTEKELQALRDRIEYLRETAGVS